MKQLKTLAKVLISVAIIALILRKLDERLLLDTLARTHWGWLLWAVAWFTVSKIIAAWRFNRLLRTTGIMLGEKENLRLYWLGMYYNLLLPGGISGDGYKIKILSDAFGVSWQRLLLISLLDRITGAIALGQWLLLGLPGLPWGQPHQLWSWLALVASIPITWGVYRWAGGALTKIWIPASLQSLGVQLAQIVATLGLVLALGQAQYLLPYTLLFLASSVVAMLPLTIGGAGARELTFLYGATWLGVAPEQAVAVGFLFYVISTAVAFTGIGFSFQQEPLSNQNLER